ncbi:Cytochrome P450 [Pyrenophora tritici-repentis]|nr:Cytochrome P450 [Pyrenophora tritici-repentis]KAI1509733.1 Cytochrome P450 [Pyrenophora tritici-repentis]KAI1665683.1 Cytochrome P450 [Pyrenophora tritici-repentis]KAI1677482.1 Cytochrome P450 [Pyrenophora tritici-repentis]
MPPTVPYWIPGLKHAFHLAFYSKTFMGNCLKKYGDGTPFILDGAGQKMCIIVDPDHIKNAIRSAKEMDPNPFIHERIMGALMGSPQSAINYYQSEESNTDYIQTTHIRHHTTGSNLGLLDTRMFETLKRTIGETLDSTGEWTEIPDLFSFLRYHVTYAVAITILGTELVSTYPDLIADLWTHIEATDQFFLGLPRIAIPKAYAARDRLLGNFRVWSTKSMELRKQNKTDTVWDPVAGSGLAQEREELYSELPGHDEYARSAQTLGLLYGGTSLSVPITFWYVYETLRSTDLNTRILGEINKHADPKTQSYRFTQLTTRPLLQSLHAETTRLYSSNLTVRSVTTPSFALDEKYSIPQGTAVFIPNKWAGMFAPGWEKTRTEALARPLHTFWAERFLVSDGEKKERFSDAGLSSTWMSFGGGEHKCPGRHFARNIGIVTLTVVMGVFEVEICDVEGARRLDPDPREKGFGTLVPRGKVAARIRRRVD